MILRLLAMALAVALSLPTAASAQTVSGGEGFLTRYIALYGYTFADKTVKQIRRDFSTPSVDCGPVQVRFQEVLYDGQWMYTAASIQATDPETTLLLPGDAETSDLVCGKYFNENATDERTYQDAAAEDGKQLIAVYVYMKEFDGLGQYFLDSFMEGTDTILLSGCQVAGGKDAVELNWMVELYEIDGQTGKYHFLDETLYPITVEPLQPYEEVIYRLADGQKSPIEYVTLVQTALCSYLLPQWPDQQARSRYAAVLEDADGQPVASSNMPAGNAFALVSKPRTLTLSLIDFESDKIDSLTFVADEAELDE